MVTERRSPTTAQVQDMIAAAIGAHAALMGQHGIHGGLHASRPAAGAVNEFYFSIDKGKWARGNGTGWDELKIYWG